MLREACQNFRKHFLQIGDVEVFLECMSITSACNRVFRKKFVHPKRIRIIPTGGYTNNNRQNKKAITWLIDKEQREGKRILHGRNGREYAFPELPQLRVDGFCEETKTVYGFMGCYWHGHDCLPFRDVKTACGGNTLAERYEKTQFRLERITRAGYSVKVQWECEFEETLRLRPELRNHPLVERGPFRTRYELNGGRTESIAPLILSV